VVPTHGRAGYLDVTLRSVVPQATAAGAEVLVVIDGEDPQSESIAARYGLRCVSLPSAQGLNAARNRAVSEVGSDLIVFIDDDVEVPPKWLEQILAGTDSSPEHDVFGGPIRARLEGGGPRACGREPAPITTIDMGSEDRDVPFVWGANMTIRRRAFDRVGRFNETILGRGDEEDWLRRYTAAGGRIRYLAHAGLDHRRTESDSTVSSLTRAAYGHGRAARRHDVRKGSAPPIARELRVLAGCLWHAARRRCAFGIVFAGHTAGRLSEAMKHRRP
jgi:glycosyltransferase involved in cell wall biosynthesis